MVEPWSCSGRSLCHSWRRAVGLFVRVSVLTLQRFLDVFTVFNHFHWGKKFSVDWVVLGIFLVLTTLLMAVTMKKHWSARLNHKPYGALIGTVTALLQIAPLWEMWDKMWFHDAMPRPQSGRTSGSLHEPLLSPPGSSAASAAAPPRSTPGKGSPGENVMRGVRKLSMVNLPQAMASLWCHIYELMPVYPPPDEHSVVEHPRSVCFLCFAFGAALLCVAFGVADIVLYIWVDDAFVRSNKKLVTVHYLFEILSRVPTVVLFHVTYSRLNRYWPTLWLLAIDMFATSVLLLMARFYQPRRLCSCLGYLCNRQSAIQFFYALLVSAPLFLVNIVFYDPGMSFFFVNKAYYVVKYLELFMMWLYVVYSRKKMIEEENMLLGLHYDANYKLQLATLFFTLVNAFLVFIWVPWKRGVKIDDLMSGFLEATASGAHGGSARDRQESRDGLTSQDIAMSRQLSTLPAGASLERFEETFELLYLLSKATQHRNRARVLETTVDDLWLQALGWEGVYADVSNPSQAFAQITMESSRNSLWIRRLTPVSDEPLKGSLVANTVMVPGPERGYQRGVFDGYRIYWEDGAIWTRQDQDSHGVRSTAHAALRLILPQLALALRWDLPVDTLTASRKRTASDVETGGRCDTPCNDGPLLDFLIRYSLITRQSAFLSDLYWTLVCLSEEDEAYTQARHKLLASLKGGITADWPAAMQEGLDQFLRMTRQLLRNQREIWRQHMELFTKHSGRESGGGTWIMRTQILRKALRNWGQHRKEAGAPVTPDIDEKLLSSSDNGISGAPQTFQQLDPFGRQTSGRISIDIVTVEDDGGRVALPIDPSMQFRGVVIEESEVIPSKQAPLMLTCRTRSMREVGSPRGLLPGSATDKDVVPEDEKESIERYLLKFGDDLRQDQLILQLMSLMSCAWEERLGEETILLSLAKFKVLAVTPSSGYVKCVPDAVPLSTALHDSQGLLDVWLEKNKPEDVSLDEVWDNFCGSVAASCVVTYVLGIGDRHLENICITPTGCFFHIDFSFVFGDDPKPIAPSVRLPQQVAQALRRGQRLKQCFNLAGEAYVALRPFAGLLGSLLRLTAEAGGAGCAKLGEVSSAMAAIAGVRERLRVDQANDERAASEFLCLMRESSEGLASIFLDKVHAAGLFWR